MDFKVAIPARFASTRLPGKPLRLLAGKPMIHHVVARALESGASEVAVATDSEQVAESVAGLDCRVCMTADTHRSGTDRLAECAERLGWPDEAVVVNLQGDEPLLPGKWLRVAAEELASHPDAAIASLCHAITDRQVAGHAGVVKVVLDESGYAMYFSRALIPWPAHGETRSPRWYRHIGVYAYRAGALRELSARPASPLEQSESLEQLRALESGYRIKMHLMEAAVPPGVDSEDDLRAVDAILKERLKGI